MESTSARPKMNVTTAKPSKSKQKYVIRDYKAMSKDDLRHELRRRGIKNNGKKTEMVRIIHEIANTPTSLPSYEENVLHFLFTLLII
ncbi:hypothetical protein TNCT_294581 [Trichonephila clavata]|uniref:SAP domain-containing protein n=1 Tax=Trichonephila clavata TaxID=2740835 RepID=A0A8X6FE08_TRICU|nr:hypothetical protein TNCT_106731 [Trichonephila clavata]GFR25015.1 hypothetical protein TNCT_294581 [Trichonephila clavata]